MTVCFIQKEGKSIDPAQWAFNADKMLQNCSSLGSGCEETFFFFLYSLLLLLKILRNTTNLLIYELCVNESHLSQSKMTSLEDRKVLCDILFVLHVVCFGKYFCSIIH